jgi:hypothetical protein
MPTRNVIYLEVLTEKHPSPLKNPAKAYHYSIYNYKPKFFSLG